MKCPNYPSILCNPSPRKPHCQPPLWPQLLPLMASNDWDVDDGEENMLRRKKFTKGKRLTKKMVVNEAG